MRENRTYGSEGGEVCFSTPIAKIRVVTHSLGLSISFSHSIYNTPRKPNNQLKSSCNTPHTTLQTRQCLCGAVYGEHSQNPLSVRLYRRKLIRHLLLEYP